MQDGEQANGYYENRNVFIKPYCERMYIGSDTLSVKTLHEINSCAKTIGDIRFSNDTLYLSTKIVSNEVCSSVEFHQFKYVITRKNIKEYTIVY